MATVLFCVCMKWVNDIHKILSLWQVPDKGWQDSLVRSPVTGSQLHQVQHLSESAHHKTGGSAGGQLSRSLITLAVISQTFVLYFLFNAYYLLYYLVNLKLICVSTFVLLLSDEDSSDEEQPVITPYEASGQSRLTNEFEILKSLGKGGFGDVIKVREAQYLICPIKTYLIILYECMVLITGQK